ncbi:MAG: hypothetical protein Q8L06_18090 [Pseudohongiella sp.]|nr:hypothetical protein [Pseudohongiella sp.]
MNIFSTVRLTIFRLFSGFWLLLLLTTSQSHAQQTATAGDTQLFDISADGQLVLQRNGFTSSGQSTTNMSVLNLSTGEADPVNFDLTGVLVNTTTGSMSDDGRYVAYQAGSRAIYLRDRVAGTTVRVTQTIDGALPNNDVAYPRVSGNGRYVLFMGRATNLVNETLPATSAFTANLFLFDRESNQITLPARGHDGALLASAFTIKIGLPQQQISADGRYVVFATTAANVHPDVPAGNIRSMLYRRDLQTGEVLLLSRDIDGNLVTGNYFDPMISRDGNHVGFTAYSLQSDLAPGKRVGGIYVKNVSTGKVTYMSENNNASDIILTGLSGNFSSTMSMSGDGQHVAFNTQSQNLLAPNPGGGWAVFVSSITESGSVAMRRISLPESTQQQTSSNEGTNPIFARGRFAIAFQSRDRTVFIPGNSVKNAPVIYTDTSMDGSTVTPPQRPALPVRQTMRVDGRPSTAIISGGVYTTANTLTNRAAAPAQLEIEVSIAPEADDVGRSIRILVVVEVAGAMLTVNADGAIVPFDENNLQFFTSRAAAAAKETLTIFNGILTAGDRAAYNIFVGYLRDGDLNQGNIIYNAEPISLVIE